jgi:hypothetical protein
MDSASEGSSQNPQNLEAPKDIRPQQGLEKALYNHYFIVSDTPFLRHMRECIPVLMEKPGSDGSAYYPPLILNRYAISLARENLAGRSSSSTNLDIESKIEEYANDSGSDPLISLMNAQIARYSARVAKEICMEERLEAWKKLSDSRAIYFREKVQAYQDGINDTAAEKDKVLMQKSLRKIKLAVLGLAATVFLGIPAALYIGGRIVYNDVWDQFTKYTDTKFDSSRDILKSDVDEYIIKLEKIADNQEKKVRDLVYSDIIPKLQEGQLSPETMNLLNELGESLKNPEDRATLKETILFLSKMMASRSSSEKKDKKDEPSPKDKKEEGY